MSLPLGPRVLPLVLCHKTKLSAGISGLLPRKSSIAIAGLLFSGWLSLLIPASQAFASSRY